MEFAEIEKRKKYYKCDRRFNSGRNKYIDYYDTIFILDTNEKEKTVLASINGTPAQWYKGSKYSKWVKEQSDTAGKEQIRTVVKKRNVVIK